LADCFVSQLPVYINLFDNSDYVDVAEGRPRHHEY